MHLRHMLGAKEECDPLSRWTAVVWLTISTGTNNPQKWWCWLTSLTTCSLLTTFVMKLVEAWQLPHGYLHIHESGGVVACMHADKPKCNGPLDIFVSRCVHICARASLLCTCIMGTPWSMQVQDTNRVRAMSLNTHQEMSCIQYDSGCSPTKSFDLQPPWMIWYCVLVPSSSATTFTMH
jgi:hypothetical protein